VKLPSALTEIEKIARSMITPLLDSLKPGTEERCKAAATVGMGIHDIIRVCRRRRFRSRIAKR
jgi:hypothetical protein